MKYITILCELSNDRAKVGKKTYWLTKDSHINAKGFALLEKTWQGSYNLLRFQDLESMETLDEISLVGESERDENGNVVGQR